MDHCNCYVNTLSEHDQFVLRWGAHALSCPIYRKSKDPIDQMKDKVIRAHYEQMEEENGDSRGPAQR
jgi:hypothetical protein